MNLRLVVPTVSLLLLPLGLSPRLASAGDEKDKAEQAALDDKPPAPRDAAELERCLFGTDREARRKAAQDALPRTTHPAILNEEVWLRFLELRFPNDAEQEEAFEEGAHALLFVGTERCLPKLEELMKRPPKCTHVVKGSASSGDPCGGRIDTIVADWAYQGEASNARRRLKLMAADRSCQARLEGLNLFERADEIAKMISKGDASYGEIRTPDMPEKAPRDWREQLAAGLASHGPAGAWGFARGLAREQNPKVRAFFMKQLYIHLPSILELKSNEAWVRAEEAARMSDGEHTEWKELQRTERSLLLHEPSTFEAVLSAVRVILAEPRKLGDKDDAVSAFWMISRYELVEVEPDLETFVRTLEPCLEQHFSRADYEKKAHEREWLELAMKQLGRFGTDRALDFLVSRSNLMFSFEGIQDGPDDFGKRLATKLLAALEREKNAPWTNRFEQLAESLSIDEVAVHINLKSVENILAEVQEIGRKATDPEQKRRAVSAAGLLEHVIDTITDTRADQRGTLEGTLAKLEREATRADGHSVQITNTANRIYRACTVVRAQVDVKRLERILDVLEATAKARIAREDKDYNRESLRRSFDRHKDEILDVIAKVREAQKKPEGSDR